MGKIIEKMAGPKNSNPKLSFRAAAPVFMKFTSLISLYSWITAVGPVFFFDQKIHKGARKS